MKLNPNNSKHEQVKAGNASWLLLTAGLSLALFSCNSSSPSSSPDARLNQHLVYGDQVEKDATLKPHQTVVLNLSSPDDDHLNVSSGSSYHKLPYEISNTGKYKYCIPDDDIHLTQVELYDPAGALLGKWQKGEPCTSVPLVPGRYTMHVHLNTTESDSPIFMKPHDVKLTQTGTKKGLLKSVTSSYDGPIPINQFLNLKVDSLSDVLKTNKAQGIKQGWGAMTPSSGESYHVLKHLQYHSSYFHDDNKNYKISDSVSLDTTSSLDGSDLLYINSEQNDRVYLLQGNNPVLLSPGYCLKQHSEQRCDECMKDGPYYTVNVCDQRGNVVELSLPGSSADSGSLFSFSAAVAATGFKLSDSTNLPVNWYGAEWVTGAGTNPVNFNVRVRYGTTSGMSYPAMLTNEVALFDSIYESSGFPANTNYWIINADLKDFSEFSFDNPTNRIKTVIAGRGVRAQLFQNPIFQGSSVYVSPPVDSEMVMTGTDNALLKDGTVGSIRIEPNSNDIPVNEYEYHVIVSGNTCIGCDLRGFDASSYTNTTSFLGFKWVSRANFSDSDLSYSNFALKQYIGDTILKGDIEYSNFSNVDFTNANLTNDNLYACNFSRTDFSKAVLTNVEFHNDFNPELAFYNACPKFEYTDLTTITGFDSYFPVGAGSLYNADNWWNSQRKLCRTSIAYSKISQTLFTDKRLWQFVDAPGVDFSNMNLDGAVFAGSNLRKAIFKNASLKGTVFVKADLTGADLSGADLTGAHLEGATLTGVDLHKAKTMSKAFLSGISISAPNLSGLDMSGAQLKSGVYTNWDGRTFELFPAASINGAYMYNTKLNGADLSYAFLNGVSWFGADATGENATMIGTHFEHADLPGLNLKKAHLQGANFTDAQMVNANLSTLNSLDYSFKGTTFYQANLRGANLSGANLNQTSLDSALIYAGSIPMYTYIEVLDNPTTNPGHYKFYQQNYTATIAPSSTNNITTCPNSTRSPELNCGELTSDYWGLPTNPPKPPTDCIERAPLPGETPSDNGMVIVCTSHRHPK